MSVEWKFEVPDTPLFDIKKAKALHEREIGIAIDSALSEVQRNIVQHTAPHGATGNLKASIRTERKGTEGRVFAGAKYAIPVELGRKEAPVPFRALINWVRLSAKGQAFHASLRESYPRISAASAAFVLARSMKRKARAGQEFFKKGVDMSRDTINQILGKLLEDIGRKMA